MPILHPWRRQPQSGPPDTGTAAAASSCEGIQRTKEEESKMWHQRHQTLYLYGTRAGKIDVIGRQGGPCTFCTVFEIMLYIFWSACKFWKLFTLKTKPIGRVCSSSSDLTLIRAKNPFSIYRYYSFIYSAAKTKKKYIYFIKSLHSFYQIILFDIINLSVIFVLIS